VSTSTLYSHFFLTHFPQPFSTNNIFDNLPSLTSTTSDIRNELDQYLATDTEDVRDGLLWWHERRTTYPHLSCMAQDYLSIPSKTFVTLQVFPSLLLLTLYLLSNVNRR
jgi:hypothetical protein